MLIVTPRIAKTIWEGIGETRIIFDTLVHDLQREDTMRGVCIPKEGEVAHPLCGKGIPWITMRALESENENATEDGGTKVLREGTPLIQVLHVARMLRKCGVSLLSRGQNTVRFFHVLVCMTLNDVL